MKDFDALRDVAEVARLGSITAAAIRRNRPQQTVSRNVRKIEDALGKVIFTRHIDGVKVAEHSAPLLESITRILDIYESISTEEPRDRSSVRLGMPGDILPTVMQVAVVKACSASSIRIQRLQIAPLSTLRAMLSRSELDLIVWDDPDACREPAFMVNFVRFSRSTRASAVYVPASLIETLGPEVARPQSNSEICTYEDVDTALAIVSSSGDLDLIASSPLVQDPRLAAFDRYPVGRSIALHLTPRADHDVALNLDSIMQRVAGKIAAR